MISVHVSVSVWNLIISVWGITFSKHLVVQHSELSKLTKLHFGEYVIYLIFHGVKTKGSYIPSQADSWGVKGADYDLNTCPVTVRSLVWTQLGKCAVCILLFVSTICCELCSHTLVVFRSCTVPICQTICLDTVYLCFRLYFLNQFLKTVFYLQTLNLSLIDNVWQWSHKMIFIEEKYENGTLKLDSLL